MPPIDNDTKQMADMGGKRPAGHDAAEADSQVLAERAQLLAFPRGQQTAGDQEVITFSLNDEGYGLEAKYIYEVIRLGNIVPLPGVRSPFCGVTNYHGTLLPVIDLLAFLQPAHATAPKKAKYLLVLGQQHAEFGILATALGPVAKVQPDQWTASVSDNNISHILGIVPSLGILVDGATLLNEPGLWINHDSI
jgi:chemotaxis signal transduction protein